MEINIVDTTLRDGEQKAGLALRVSDKVYIARLLDSLGIFQIEAGTPAMGGDEKKSIKRIMELGLKARVSAWNRMNTGDIKQSMDCGVDIIHISVPSSDIQIKTKLNKDRNWVIDNMRECILHAMDKGFEVTIGLEDASRADFKFMMRIIAVAFLEGVKRVRYADTVGVLHRQRAYKAVLDIKEELNIEIEMHAHNDFGMAISNSFSAARAGAKYIDCTVGGIGERAGNCDFLNFMSAGRKNYGLFGGFDLDYARSVQKEIMSIIKRTEEPRYSNYRYEGNVAISKT